MIAGKVMMDRHAPDFLLDTPETSYEDSKSLIENGTTTEDYGMPLRLDLRPHPQGNNSNALVRCYLKTPPCICLPTYLKIQVKSHG